MIKRLLTVLVFSVSASAFAAEPSAPPPARIDKLTPRISVISAGYNGLITVFASEKGPIVVDAAGITDVAAVKGLVAGVDPRPIAAIILTHYHSDHSAGLAQLAEGTTLLLQKECLAALEAKEAKTAELVLAKADSVVAYETNAKLRFGPDTIELVHTRPSHTAGDTVVVFPGEKVISAGDLAFIGLPPYIDVADGADTAAWADTIETLSTRYAGYKVIPGHGPVTDTTRWLEFDRYLRTLRARVSEAVAAGKSRDETQAEVKLDEFSGLTDVGDFLTKKANVGWVYDELTRKK